MNGGVGAGPWAGQFNFNVDTSNPFDTNHTFANALIGSFQNYTEIDAFSEVKGRRLLSEFYLQDTWKANRRLTFDYGMRFLWYQPWHSSQPAAVFVPERGGGWSVLFPDLPGCATQGETVHEALAMAGEAAGGWIAVTRGRGNQVPAPRSYEEIRGSDGWASCSAAARAPSWRAGCWCWCTSCEGTYRPRSAPPGGTRWSRRGSQPGWSRAGKRCGHA